MNEQHTILLVDDSENDRVLLRAAFKRAEVGNPLREVQNGEEALVYLKGEGAYSDRVEWPLPAVMLLDLNMPRKNGFDVLQWVRAQPGLKRMTIVILSASMREEDVERAFDLGATSFLVKPSSLEALTAMIRSLGNWMQISHYPALHGAAGRSEMKRSA